ncbi:hypothetical protein P3T43_002408 [Paraburkholderia sp. GAS41]
MPAKVAGDASCIGVSAGFFLQTFAAVACPRELRAVAQPAQVGSKMRQVAWGR